MSDRSDKSRKSWNTEDEIAFIDKMKARLLKKYALVLRDRDDWTGMDRSAVLEHMKKLTSKQ